MSYYENDYWDWCACGRKKRAAFSTCWQCKQEQAEHEAHMRGFREGFMQGAEHGYQYATNEAKAMQKLHPELVKRLILLCHPDKHGGSQTATEVTQGLLTQR